MEIAQEGSQLTLGVNDEGGERAEEATGRFRASMPEGEERRLLERLRVCLENLDH